MDLKQISQQLTQEEFDRFLVMLKDANNERKLFELVEKYEQILAEGTDHFSAMSFSYFDVIVTPKLGSNF